jgi:hypothetical protein
MSSATVTEAVTKSGATVLFSEQESFSLDSPEGRMLAGIPGPAYAIDDQTAIKVVDGTVEVVSEGHWKLFTPSPEAS